MDSAYWGLGDSSEGSIYFALCTHQPQASATVFRYKTDKVEKLFVLEDYIKNKKSSLTQGKVHTPILEGKDGLLYFGTHFAYPFGEPQPITYEGGHVVSYDYEKNIVTDLGIPLLKDGILSLAIDKEREFLYMLTAPSFNFIAYDIAKKKYHSFGRITDKGSICRTLTIDDLGDVYGSFEENKIFRLNKKTFKLEYLEVTLPSGDNKIEEWADKTRGGVNSIGRNIWRSVVWNEETKQVYGIHAGTSKLFAFSPEQETIEELDFMGADKDKNHPELIYPTLSLSQYKNILFYVPASGFFDYARSDKVNGYSHLVSYDVLNHKRIDHGEIKDEKGRKVFGVAGSVMSKNGKFYLLGAVEVMGDEEYNKHNFLQRKPFHLGLIEIDTTKII